MSEKICEYMRDCVDEHIDQATGEVNCTTLAEDACYQFGDYMPGSDEVPEYYFECAYRVAQEQVTA